MNKHQILLLAIVVCCLTTSFVLSPRKTTIYLKDRKCIPDHLRCEYLQNPLGIDTSNPRLSWQMNDDSYGAVQTAYQIVVDIDSSAVAKGNGNVWNSGEIASDRMLVAYAGKPLLPFTKYYWSVKIRDKDGVVTSQSAPASFETGMMSKKNWKGAWISDGNGDMGNDIRVKPAPYFRKEFDVRKKIKSARAYIVAAGLYELYINGRQTGDHRLDPMYTR
ncbi:MAG: alpha-L-rhamnosidase N-terminal domain-containing protein, partial [Bacteroidales bacterium]|nr:alpha-L-rhamnosidase N-terminal domain-containing protein [Bacteroidales bacterium]